MARLAPRQRVEKFVLRARKVMAHSLVREHMDLLNELGSGTVKVRVLLNRNTGATEHRILMDLPPEEAFESFAARLRPFTMLKEPIYWEAVLDAIGELVSEDTKAEVVDLDGLREHWSRVLKGNSAVQAYYAVTERGKMTDAKLADLWLNSDFLHAQPIQSAVANSLTLDQRYQAAAGVYARLGACVNSTLFLVNHLCKEGLIDLDPDVFEEVVVVETTIDLPGRVYSAEVGAELPSDLSDLDPDVWRPIDEDIAFPDDPDHES